MPIPLLLHGKHGHPLATYQAWGPWIVPWRFDTFEAESEALRARVGLLDYSTQALIEVGGSDRVDLLHRLLTNDIQHLAAQSGCEAALLTPSGKLVAPLRVLANAESIWLMCEMPLAETIMRALEQYHFSEQVTFTNHERASAVLALQGPRTMEFLTEAFGRVVSLPRPGDHLSVSFDGIPVWVIRQSLTGELGVLCIVNAGAAELVWNHLNRPGRSTQPTRVGWEALNAARIEAGFPWFGVDMDETHLLPETGWDAVAVSETKGCYLGQEIMARLRAYGSVSKRLVGLLLEPPQTAEPGDPIVRDAETLGHVTSACTSPALQRPIAMGYVKRPHYETSTAVEILHGAQRLPATVVARPFIPLNSP